MTLTELIKKRNDTIRASYWDEDIDFENLKHIISELMHQIEHLSEEIDILKAK